MRRYASKIAVESSTGQYIRTIHPELARALVASGAATVEGSGKIRVVRLAQPASSHAQMIGPATGRATGVRFTRREMLDESGARIWQHHPRCCWTEPE